MSDSKLCMYLIKKNRGINVMTKSQNSR